VSINVRGAKNDVEGEGQQYYFQTAAQGEHTAAAFDIVRVLFDWSLMTRGNMPTDMFFGSRSDRFKLQYRSFNLAIKKVAKVCGLPPHRFSTHSLRIGGASILAAAGVPDYVIQKMGRWKSLAFLTYIRMAKSAFGVAADAITDTTIFCVQDLLRMCSGVVGAG